MCALVLRTETPASSEMEDFTSSVALWLKMDTEISRLKTALRERRVAKQRLTEGILTFMMRFGIDDLDTLECRLSCRVRQVQMPLPQRVIHQRIAGLYADDPATARSVTDTVFNRDRVEKISLRRGAARSR